MLKLSGKQARFLRGLGHHLKPVVMIGKDGVSASVIAATDHALVTHELIKAKLQEGSPCDRKEVADTLSRGTHSSVAQILGRTILLYRRNPENSRIELP